MNLTEWISLSSSTQTMPKQTKPDNSQPNLAKPKWLGLHSRTISSFCLLLALVLCLLLPFYKIVTYSLTYSLRNPAPGNIFWPDMRAELCRRVVRGTSGQWSWWGGWGAPLWCTSTCRTETCCTPAGLFLSADLASCRKRPFCLLVSSPTGKPDFNEIVRC